MDGEPLLDLAYDEDSRADVDMNIVKTGDGRFIEVQGTAEGAPFDRAALDALLDLADDGIRELNAPAAGDRGGDRLRMSGTIFRRIVSGKWFPTS